jgi:hypothetical protein
MKRVVVHYDDDVDKVTDKAPNFSLRRQQKNWMQIEMLLTKVILNFKLGNFEKWGEIFPWAKSI